MKQDVKMVDVRAALAWIKAALLADNPAVARRRYNTAEKLAKHAGIDIHVVHNPLGWPPASLAKSYLQLVLSNLEQEGTE